MCVCNLSCMGSTVLRVADSTTHCSVSLGDLPRFLVAFDAWRCPVSEAVEFEHSTVAVQVPGIFRGARAFFF